MKKSLLALLVFYSASLFAQTSTVLGIPEGTYSGRDVLVPQMPLVPTIEFSTTRILRNGTITAKTRGYLLGHEIGGAQARLKVKEVSPNVFALEDMDQPDGRGGYAVAGNGSCTQNSCAFTATVMGGSLKLRETWARGGANEFFIMDGWQNLNGVVGTYSSRLTKN